MKIKASTLIFITLGSLAAVACLPGNGCEEPYWYSRVEFWFDGHDTCYTFDEWLYYTYSDEPYITPDCHFQDLPVTVASVNYKTDAVSTIRNDYWPYKKRYLIILHYDLSVVHCWDMSDSALAVADYPWLDNSAYTCDTSLMTAYYCQERPDTSFTFIYNIQ